MTRTELYVESHYAAFEAQDAYMALSYTNWYACAAVLLRAGFTKEETVTVLRSKHMRWASDCRSHDRRPTSRDLKAYVDNSIQAIRYDLTCWATIAA
jgi:hypothetical protein